MQSSRRASLRGCSRARRVWVRSCLRAAWCRLWTAHGVSAPRFSSGRKCARLRGCAVPELRPRTTKHPNSRNAPQARSWRSGSLALIVRSSSPTVLDFSRARPPQSRGGGSLRSTLGGVSVAARLGVECAWYRLEARACGMRLAIDFRDLAHICNASPIESKHETPKRLWIQ